MAASLSGYSYSDFAITFYRLDLPDEFRAGKLPQRIQAKLDGDGQFGSARQQRFLSAEVCLFQGGEVQPLARNPQRFLTGLEEAFFGTGFDGLAGEGWLALALATGAGLPFANAVLAGGLDTTFFPGLTGASAADL